jgi:hypothetical protein
MATKIVIAVGYDNPLTEKDIEAIEKIKKFDKGKLYEWSILYYTPNTPRSDLVGEAFSIMDQNFRDKAKRALQYLSEKLGISLPMRERSVDYHQAIESGSTAIIYAVRAMKTGCVILTSDQDKIEFDIFDIVVNCLKRTRVWQHIISRSTQKSESQPIIITPEQFLEGIERQLSGKEVTCQKSRQQMQESRRKLHTKIRQKAHNAIIPFRMSRF